VRRIAARRGWHVSQVREVEGLVRVCLSAPEPRYGLTAVDLNVRTLEVEHANR
jgi:hypothetical protein